MRFQSAVGSELMPRVIAIVAWIVLQAVSAAFETGDQLVAVRPTDMKSSTGSTFHVTPGTPLTVRGVEGDRLKVAAPRVGWIEAGAVIPAKEAEAFFSQQAENGADKAMALLARGK